MAAAPPDGLALPGGIAVAWLLAQSLRDRGTRVRCLTDIETARTARALLACGQPRIIGTQPEDDSHGERFPIASAHVLCGRRAVRRRGAGRRDHAGTDVAQRRWHDEDGEH